MPEKTQESQEEIRPTPVTDVGQPATEDQLEQLQDQMFGKKSESKEAKKEVPEDPPEKKDTAKTLFEKTTENDQTINKADQENADEGEDDDSEFDSSGSFIDVAKLMGDEPGKEQPAEGKKAEEPKPASDLDKETNIKNLRKIAGTFKTERDQAQTKIEELQAQLNGRPDTNGLQSKVATLENRIKELEPYELVFGLHNNPEFKERYIQGADNLIGEMATIANDYGVDESVVQELLLSTNRKEIDDLLSDNFSSSEARSDLKSLKQRYDGLQKEKRDYEKTPEEAFRKFEESQAEAKAEKFKRRNERFQEVTQSGWSAALSANSELAENQRINELIEIPGKKEHNERVARPTMKSANDLYSLGIGHIEKMIRSEAVIDGSFATWFASIAQQAAATQMLNYSRSAIHDKYLELLKSTEKNHSQSRPGVTSPSRSKPISTGSGEKVSGKDRALQIFTEVQEEFPAS